MIAIDPAALCSVSPVYLGDLSLIMLSMQGREALEVSRALAEASRTIERLSSELVRAQASAPPQEVSQHG